MCSLYFLLPNYLHTHTHIAYAANCVRCIYVLYVCAYFTSMCDKTHLCIAHTVQTIIHTSSRPFGRVYSEMPIKNDFFHPGGYFIFLRCHYHDQIYTWNAHKYQFYIFVIMCSTRRATESEIEREMSISRCNIYVMCISIYKETNMAIYGECLTIDSCIYNTGQSKQEHFCILSAGARQPEKKSKREQRRKIWYVPGTSSLLIWIKCIRFYLSNVYIHTQYWVHTQHTHTHSINACHKIEMYKNKNKKMS